MALSAQNVETTDTNDFLVLVFHDSLGPGKGFRPLLLSGFVRIDLFPLEKLAGHEIRVSTEQYVCTAAGHVGGNRDCAFTSGLRNDLCFALVILGVENVMGNRLTLKPSCDQLRVFDRHSTNQ